ncbi:MAG: tRNA-binding protein, partial [Phycisphaerales bacterium]|nr:tRNA-binding protein [Phycisphaerales bacterium]
DTVQIGAFHALAIHVGRVLSAEVNARASRPAYVLRIDLGDELGVRTSSAQITDTYTPGLLVGRLVLALVNIPPRRVAGVKSEALVLGVYSQGGDGPVVLIGPDEHDHVRPGDRVG